MPDRWVALRPHVKTPNLPVAEMLRDAGAQGFTVSTLQEAEYLFAAGFDDLFYAVPADAMKRRRAAPVLRAGKRLSLLVDTLAARAIGDVARDEAVIASVWVEIDVDHYRTGIRMDDPDFGHIVHLLSTHPNLKLAGIMSYGGASYGCPTPDATANLTERHRLALLQARTRACSMGFALPASASVRHRPCFMPIALRGSTRRAAASMRFRICSRPGSAPAPLRTLHSAR